MSSRSFFLVSAAFAVLACSSDPQAAGDPTPGPGDSSSTTLPGGGGGTTPAPGGDIGGGQGAGDIGIGDPGGDTGQGGAGGSGCDSVLEVVYRDFDVPHPDFEMDFKGDVVRRQLVEPELDADRKPVFLSSVGCQADLATPLGCNNGTPNQPVIANKASFDQWYRDVEGVNISFRKELALVETPPGSGQYVFDSTDFFPLAPEEGFGITPPNHKNQNFLFTTEIHMTFGYVQGQKFSFRGDDDMWIFVNGKLAVDLGSMHSPESGVIDFDAQADYLGISPGNSYEMDIFHAERHTDGSNFHIETNISCFTPVDVPL